MGRRKNTKGLQQASLLDNSGQSSSRARKQEPGRAVRSSNRLKGIQIELTSGKAQSQQDYPQRPHSNASSGNQKRKRDAEALQQSDPVSDRRKRARIPPGAPSFEGNSYSSEQIATDKDEDPISYWSRHGCWPRGHWNKATDMSHVLARKKSEASLAQTSSNTGSASPSYVTPSDQKPREVKSAPYRHPGYKVLLGTLGSFMDSSEHGIKKQSKTLCHDLLVKPQEPPTNSLFRDDLFEETCRMVHDRNEAKVIRDISPLIVPSAQTLAIYGSKHLKKLIESINEGWNNSVPFTKTRPQPDYAVGFRREAFTEDQLKKMAIFFGELFDVSYFKATYYMYLPFLTCEVKCGASALDIADRQNAHSMTIAVRGIVELFRLANREQELHQEILAFSISHNDQSIRIYGHYAEINGRDQKYYRYRIRDFTFTELDGREKWTAYKFVKNIYDIWMPEHFKRLSEVIDQLPANVNFEVSQQSDLNFTDRSGLSQDLEAANLAQSLASTQSAQEPVDNQSSVGDAQDATPNTSVQDGALFKKPRKRGRNSD